MVVLTEQEFHQLACYIKDHFGINLTGKKHLVMGRLQGTLAEHDFESFSDFYQYLLNDTSGETATQLVNKITTNHTFFLREIEHFRYFRDRVLPDLVVNLRERDLRVWSAGCSSGQEPYTLAMILADYFGDKKPKWDTRILATDISEHVLALAAEGIYNNEAIEKIPAHWRMQYFKSLDHDQCVVHERIRNEVVFRRFNLMNTVFPFKRRFHVIFCRNVMIYFDQQTKQELVNRFYEITEPGGYLFVGHAESLGRQETRYRCLAPAVYRKE